jgi:hypothetical protein
VVCCLHRSAWGFVRRQDRESRRTCSFVRLDARRGSELVACLSPSGRTTAIVSIALSSGLKPPYLYACVLGSEVDGAVGGRVCDTEDVSDVVGRPERVEVLEGCRTPDLAS